MNIESCVEEHCHEVLVPQTHNKAQRLIETFVICATVYDAKRQVVFNHLPIIGKGSLLLRLKEGRIVEGEIRLETYDIWKKPLPEVAYDIRWIGSGLNGRCVAIEIVKHERTVKLYLDIPLIEDAKPASMALEFISGWVKSGHSEVEIVGSWLAQWDVNGCKSQ